MRKYQFLLLVLFVFVCENIYSQNNIWKPNPDALKIVFYNVENLFDTIDNPDVVGDEEFTPEGVKYWGTWRYNNKLIKIWKAIAAVGGRYYLPDIICFSEVENALVLKDLLCKTPLGQGDYSFFHRESLSYRGIDVAILYKLSAVEIIDTLAIRINFDDDYHSRDILYLRCVSKISSDTVSIFANHWPSKYGGLAETERHREKAASTLRRVVDSVFALENEPKIVCGGDFNSGVAEGRVDVYMHAEKDFSSVDLHKLYNLTSRLVGKKFSYKFHGVGEILDQVFVSGSLINSTVDIADFAFLLEPDLKYVGKKPFRTYLGYKYLGGFSDHLPVVLSIPFKK